MGVCSAFTIFVLFLLKQGTDAQYTAYIERNPSSSTYPLFSSLTLTCVVSPSPFGSISYSWITTECFQTSDYNGGNPACFPHGQTSQSVTGSNLRAEDAVDSLSCRAVFQGTTVTSSSITITISGTAMIGGSNALNAANVIPNNGHVIEPGSRGVIARCVTGVPPGTAGINSFLGGWFRDGSQLPVDESCSSGAPVETRGSSVSEGYIGSNDLYRCGSSFTTFEEGVYECVSVVGGPGVTQTLTLNVYASSRTSPTIDTPSPSHINTDAGVSVSLTCRSRGSVPDSFTWGQDGSTYGSGTTTAETYTSSSAVYRSTYTINRAQSYHTGTWTCTVSNLIGSDSASITLQVGPTLPSNVRATTLGSRSIRVTWSPSSFGAIRYRILSYLLSFDYVGYLEVSGGSQSSVDFTDLEENTGYRFSVRAIGNSDVYTTAVGDAIATTLTAAPSSPPQSVAATAVDPSSLRVTWQQPPEIDHNGPLTGYQIRFRQVGRSTSTVSTSSTSYTLTGLTAYVQYTVQVAAVNSDGTGPFSSSLTSLSGQDIPSVPRSLTVDGVNDSAVSLSWMSPDPANGIITQYMMEYRRSVDSSYTSVTLSATTLMYTVSGLDVDTEYQFRVRASTRVGNGPYTDAVTQETEGTAPTNVMVTIQQSPSRVMVTWDPPPADADMVTSYIVYYDGVESFVNDGNVTVTMRSATIDLPEEFVTYRITIQAMFGGTLGVPSQAVSIMTLSSVPDGPPQDINLAGVDPAMLSVRYSRPLVEHVNGDLTGYMIRYSRVGSGEVEVMSVVNGDNLSSLISGLVAYVNYSIEVAASNINGTGPFSDPVFGLSGQDVPSSAPRSLTVDDIGARYLVISWTVPSTPNGVITQYELQYREANDTSYSGQNVSNSDTLIVTIGSLSPNTFYTLNIRAYTYLGRGPFSDSVNVTTLPQAPDPVSTVTVQSRLSSSMLTVSWMEPYVPNGVISYYIVFYLPVNNTYGAIMEGTRKRQLVEDGEFTANFNESPGTLTNLNGSVTYMIQVSAVAIFNGVELIGDRSTATVGTTAEGAPSAPRALSSFNVTKTDIGVRWQRPDPPNGLIIEYTVSYNVSKTYLNQSTGAMELFDDYDIMDVTATNDITYSIDFTELFPGTQHQFSVVAYTSVGPGDIAELSITTLPDVPPDPPTPQVTDTTDTTASLMIYETSNINGDIQYYTIIVQRDYMGLLLYNVSSQYNEEAADVASDNGQSYGYISGIVAVSNIISYPYSYELGDGRRSNYGEVEYVNVPLTANTTHVVVVRAYTADELYANSMAIEFHTNVTIIRFPQYGECDNGAVVAVATLLAVFVIGFAISAMVNVFCVMQRKKSRYHVEVKSPQAKSSSSVQNDEAIYEDVTYDINGTTKDTIIPNPAYGTMSRVDISQNPSYVMSEQNTEDGEYL
ncbi:protein sidekick-2-like isoform X2 [Dysidea avara]|uniref:protein sidekick-2-like isoform X2 n=1 Tax=Dysidea avara TaxID=196820 RepID=UPI003324C9D7